MNVKQIELRFGPKNKYVMCIAVTEENRETLAAQLLAALEALNPPCTKKKELRASKNVFFL
jgi:hypothetical protein